MEHKESIYVNLIRAHFVCHETERHRAACVRADRQSEIVARSECADASGRDRNATCAVAVAAVSVIVHFILFGFYMRLSAII